MDNQQKKDQIWALLLKLRAGYDWMMDHPAEVERNEALIARSQPIIDELTDLGIKKSFALRVLLMGPSIDQQFFSLVFDFVYQQEMEQGLTRQP